ncbi:MAG: hypothetical protein U1C18_01305, partial [Patescibacteria group bacterium]|nr:hypothetical protein [Patescibacteria group bacterium]
MIFLFHSRYRRAKALYQQHERVLIPGMLVFGFIVDYITFKTIQVHIALTVLSCYFALAGGLIAFTRFYDAEKISQRFRFVRLAAPLAIQYTFGALLGASFVFYWFSASLAASWPFIAILAGLMVGNEALRKQIQRHSVQLSVYYFISFSFFSITLPYLAHDLGPKLFLLAGLASLGYMYAYVRL